MLVKQKKDPRTWVYFLLPGLVVFLFVCFFSVSLQRLSYPYEIEWIEGGVLHQVTRVLDGLPLYTQPSMDFIPALYTPFYYYISAFFTGILGWGFFPLRLVSFCASIGVMCSIGWVVYEYSRNRLFAFVGAGFFVAMYRFTDFWFDVARVDSLWTFFLSVPLACLLVYRIRPNLQLLVLAGVFYALAIYTKQSSLFLGPFVVVSLWLLAGWRGWFIFGFSSAVPVLLFLLLFQWQSDGLFYYFTMEMARSHGFNIFGLGHFITGDTLFSVPVFMGLACVFCFRHTQKGKDFWGVFILFCGFTAISLVSRAYPGGHLNVLMPFYMCIAMYSAIAFPVILKANVGDAKMWVPEAGCKVMPGLLITANLIWAMYPVSAQIPDEANRRAGDRLVEKIRKTPGRVCVGSHGYLAYMAGKDFCAHNTQLTDLLWSAPEGMTEAFMEGLNKRVFNGYYAVIVLDNKAELLDWQLGYKDIPYRVEKLDDYKAFRQVVSGGNPALWLVFQGSQGDAGNTEK